jgi:thioredoxin reductase (NADPH)
MERKNVKCLIIGGGPAGYTAGIYASRAGLEPVLIEGMQPGGQLTITSEVENFPGYPNGNTGYAIMEDIREQAMKTGTCIQTGMITKVDFSRRPFSCIHDDKIEYLADTVIIATGATARWLGLESEKQYRGFGVSACATCDGAFFIDKVVAVIGGGETAVEEALYLAKRCKKVYLVHRRNQLRATEASLKKIINTSNIELLWNYVPLEIIGKQAGFVKKVTGIRLQSTVDDSESTVDLDGVFIAIGTSPVTELFEGQLNLDENAYIQTQAGTPFTNIQGVFAAGDVQDTRYRQAITAAASGCIAAIEAFRFLSN